MLDDEAENTSSRMQLIKGGSGAPCDACQMIQPRMLPSSSDIPLQNFHVDVSKAIDEAATWALTHTPKFFMGHELQFAVSYKELWDRQTCELQWPSCSARALPMASDDI